MTDGTCLGDSWDLILLLTSATKTSSKRHPSFILQNITTRSSLPIFWPTTRESATVEKVSTFVLKKRLWVRKTWVKKIHQAHFFSVAISTFSHTLLLHLLILYNSALPKRTPPGFNVPSLLPNMTTPNDSAITHTKSPWYHTPSNREK